MPENKTELDLYREIGSIKDTARKNGKVRGFGKSAAVVDNSSIAGSIFIQDSVPKVSTPSTETAETVSEPTEPAVEETTETPESSQAPSFSLEDIQRIITNAITPVQQQALQAQQDALQAQQEAEQARQQLSQAQAELEQTRRDSAVLSDLGRLAGNPNPTNPAEKNVNFNTTTSVNGEPRGLAKEFLDLLNDKERCKTNYNVGGHSPVTGYIYANQRDHTPIAQFIQRVTKEEKAKGRSFRDSYLVKDIESWFKANGFLQGRNTNAVTGPMTGASGQAVNAFLDVLSAMMRETHNFSNIFWQFTTTVFDPTSEPSKNILIPRWNYLDEPTSVSDYLIANTTTFNPINLIVGTSSDSQGIPLTTVPVTVAQYGLGLGGSSATRPVFVPEFHQATSLLSLIDAVDTRLMQNYYRFEELLIRSQYELATNIVYNDAGRVTSTAADVGLGDEGTMTKEYLHALYWYMFSQKIPTYPDGMYTIALGPTAASQLQQSLEQQYRPVSEDQMENITNIFRIATGVEIGRASGYIGDYCNFHVFSSNSFSTGTAGSVPTVNNVVFGAGTYTCEDSFAFGPGAVGRGVAMPMEIRNQSSPFNLGEAFIWTSRENSTTVDLDSTLGNGSQTRCIRARTSRISI